MADVENLSASLSTNVKCGAKKRNGDPCQNRAGYKTDHVGIGKCWLHGGLTPIKHGRYSKVMSVLAITNPNMTEVLERFQEKPDILMAAREVAAIALAKLQMFSEKDEDRSVDLLSVCVNALDRLQSIESKTMQMVPMQAVKDYMERCAIELQKELSPVEYEKVAGVLKLVRFSQASLTGK